jgi:hypothetical protein
MNRGELLFTVGLGAAGGAALVTIMRATTRGPVILVAYALMSIAAVLYLRRRRDTSFLRRLSCAFGAFAIATTIAFLYVVAIAAPGALNAPWWENAGALALVLAIGLPVCALIAAVSKRISQSAPLSS